MCRSESFRIGKMPRDCDFFDKVYQNMLLNIWIFNFNQSIEYEKDSPHFNEKWGIKLKYKFIIEITTYIWKYGEFLASISWSYIDDYLDFQFS